MDYSLSKAGALGCLALLLTLAGCGGVDPASKLAALNETNMQRLANLYFAYQKKHDFHGPPNEEAFRGFVESYNPKKLERIGVDPTAIDQLFVSERDGQPFRIRYRVVGSMMGSQEPVVFESDGEDGMRMVAFLNMTQREVDTGEYDQLFAGQTPAIAARDVVARP